MQLRLAVILITALLLSAGCNPDSTSVEFSSTMESYLAKLQDESPELFETAVFNPGVLNEFYTKEKDLLPARWDNLENIEQLVNTVRYVYRDGLNPEDYHLFQLESLFDSVLLGEPTIADSVVFDILLTDAFLTVAAHFAGGKTDRRTLRPVWNLNMAESDTYWKHLLDSSLTNMQVEENLLSLLPVHNEYRSLRSSLAKYREIGEKEGWEHFSTSLGRIEKGMMHPDVGLLRSRLAAEQGDPAVGSEDNELFDSLLQKQVELFQARHSLPADGIVDDKVIAAMNLPLYHLIDVIEANLDRWRWMPPDIAERTVRVNIAGFQLRAIENDNTELSLNVIVGTTETPTPVFASAIKWIELNPYWIVPPGMLEYDEDWTGERLAAESEDGENIFILLSDPMPVKIMYITAKTGEDGHVYWADDVYSFDGAVSSSLKSSPPAIDL